METFHTEKERDEAVATAISLCLDDGWSEGVEQIVSGYLTHTCEKINVVNRPPQLPIEASDEVDGVWWAEGINYCCSYKMTLIDEERSKS